MIIVLFDHGQLLHYGVRGSADNGMPSGAVIDETQLQIMHAMDGMDTANSYHWGL